MAFHLTGLVGPGPKANIEIGHGANEKRVGFFVSNYVAENNTTRKITVKCQLIKQPWKNSSGRTKSVRHLNGFLMSGSIWLIINVLF